MMARDVHAGEQFGRRLFLQRPRLVQQLEGFGIAAVENVEHGQRGDQSAQRAFVLDVVFRKDRLDVLADLDGQLPELGVGLQNVFHCAVDLVSEDRKIGSTGDFLFRRLGQQKREKEEAGENVAAYLPTML